MPAVTRELQVTYGGITLGGASSTYLLFDRHRVFGSYEDIGFEGHVMVVGSSEALFATACAALESAFQTPNGTLTVVLGAATPIAFGHAANTGFLGRPRWRKVGGAEDTARSRLYEVAVVAQRPADLTGKSGLKIASLEVLTSFFGVRNYRVSGTYTALSGNSSTAQYTAAIASFLTAFETSLSGTWLRTDATRVYDDENKVLHFTQAAAETGLREGRYEILTDNAGIRSYRVQGVYASDNTNASSVVYAAAIGALLTAFETALTGTWERLANTLSYDQADKFSRFEATARELKFNQSSGLLDNASIKNHIIAISRSQVAPGDSDHGIERPVDMVISFDCDVDVLQTTDLSSLFENTIKPYLISLARNTTTTGVMAVTELNYAPDLVRNRITASVRVQAYGSSLLMLRRTVTEEEETGVIFVTLWSGNRFAKRRIDGPARKTREVVERSLRIGTMEHMADGSSAIPSGITNDLGTDELPTSWVRIMHSEERMPYIVGTGDSQVPLIEKNVRDIYEYFEEPL